MSLFVDRTKNIGTPRRLVCVSLGRFPHLSAVLSALRGEIKIDLPGLSKLPNRPSALGLEGCALESIVAGVGIAFSRGDAEALPVRAGDAEGALPARGAAPRPAPRPLARTLASKERASPPRPRPRPLPPPMK